MSDSTVAIIGLDYVGLTLCLQFARSGSNVLGLDIDAKKVDAINVGQSYIHHFTAESVAVDDDRESPSYVLMDLIKAAGAEVAYHAPYVAEIKLTREHPHWAGTRSLPWEEASIAKYDAALISTAHANVNYVELLRWSQIIVDTRNAMKDFQPNSKIVPA